LIDYDIQGDFEGSVVNKESGLCIYERLWLHARIFCGCVCFGVIFMSCGCCDYVIHVCYVDAVVRRCMLFGGCVCRCCRHIYVL